MFGIGQTELLLLAGILVLLFGASRLPSLMRNMGRSIGEFKQGLRDEPDDKENLESQDGEDETKALEEKEEERVS